MWQTTKVPIALSWTRSGSAPGPPFTQHTMKKRGAPDVPRAVDVDEPGARRQKMSGSPPPAPPATAAPTAGEDMLLDETPSCSRPFCWRESLAAAVKSPGSDPALAAALAEIDKTTQPSQPAAGGALARAPVAIPPQVLITALHSAISSAGSDAELILLLRAYRPAMLPILTSAVHAAVSGRVPFDLRRHERLGYACSLLSRLMPGSEQVMALLDFLYNKAPSPFERLFQQGIPAASSAAPEGVLDIVRTALRMLASGYRGSVNWAPLFGLLQSTNTDVRWHAGRCVSTLLEMPAPLYRQLESKFQIGPDEPRSTFASEEQAVAVEHALSFHGDPASPAPLSEENVSEWVAGLAVVNGIVFPLGEPHRQPQTVARPKKGGGGGGGACSGGQNFVSTVECEKNLHSLALALGVGKPVLLEGPPGAGKTALVEELAKRTGQADGLIRIHLDDQLDSKVLLGTYVCTDVPGQFRWQPGALTQAVSGGGLQLQPIQLQSLWIIPTAAVS